MSSSSSVRPAHTRNRLGLGLAASLLGVALVAGCSSSPPREGRDYNQTGRVSGTTSDRQAQYGRVTRIDNMPEERRRLGVGTVLGAVVGGALGNQVGSGSGRTAATVAGAVGGAAVGNRVDNREQGQTAGYEVYVRMDNGDSRVIPVADPAGLEVGERVRLEGSNIVRL